MLRMFLCIVLIYCNLKNDNILLYMYNISLFQSIIGVFIRLKSSLERYGFDNQILTFNMQNRLIKNF